VIDEKKEVLLAPTRVDFSEVNQVKFEHDRVAWVIIKTIYLSLGVVNWGWQSKKSRVPKNAQHSSWLVVGK